MSMLILKNYPWEINSLMGIIYKHAIYKVLQLLPLILLFFISLKDDVILNLKLFDFLSLNLQYIIIYYWVLKNPSILGYGYIFLAGIITDVILGLPMGLSPLSYLTVATLATYTRIVTVKINLMTDWMTFIPALLSANLIYFLVLYFYDSPVSYINILKGSFFTFCAYPLFWFPFELLRKLIKVV